MPTSTDEVRRGKKPYCKGSLDKLSLEAVVERLRSTAEAGDAQAQFMLAKSLELGIGTTEDRQAALEWYKRAAQTAIDLLHRRDRLSG